MAVAFDSAIEFPTGAVPHVSAAFFDTASWTPVGTLRGITAFVVTFLSATDHALTVKVNPATDNLDVPSIAGGVATDTLTEPGVVHAFHLGAGIPAGSLVIRVNRTNDAIGMYAVIFGVTALADTEATGVVLLQENQAGSEQNVTDGSPGTDSLRLACAFYGGASIPGVGVNSTGGPNIDATAYTAQAVRETTAGQGSRPVGFAAAASDDWASVHLAVRELGGVPADVPYLAMARHSL